MHATASSTQIQITQVQRWHCNLSPSSVGDGCSAGIRQVWGVVASVMLPANKAVQLQMNADTGHSV